MKKARFAMALGLLAAAGYADHHEKGVETADVGATMMSEDSGQGMVKAFTVTMTRL